MMIKNNDNDDHNKEITIKNDDTDINSSFICSTTFYAKIVLGYFKVGNKYQCKIRS